MLNNRKRIKTYDLMVEYIIYKITNGYNPYFYTEEFANFIYYIEKEISIRIFECDIDSIIKSIHTKKVDNRFNIKYDYSKKDYKIYANYSLNNDLLKTTLTYILPKEEVNIIKSKIDNFLKREEKRTINEETEYTKEEYDISKIITSNIVLAIWNNYVNTNIKNRLWPKQCTDIYKYLLDKDLALEIELESIKDKLLDFYKEIPKKIAIMYHNDKYLRINSREDSLLAKANYDLIFSGYKELLEKYIDKYHESLIIDLSHTDKNDKIIGQRLDFDDKTVKHSEINLNNGSEERRLIKTLDHK